MLLLSMRSSSESRRVALTRAAGRVGKSGAASRRITIASGLALSPARTYSSGFDSGSASSSGSGSARFPRAQRLAGFDGPTVWEEFTPLALRTKSINLGQGAPGFAPEPWVTDKLIQVLRDGANHQYTRSASEPSLGEALLRRYSRIFAPHIAAELDPLRNFVATVGCTEGMFMAFQAHFNPGDEVCILEPAMDIYAADVSIAGARPMPLPMRFDSSRNETGDFVLDMEALRETLRRPKMRGLVLNSPMNPIGKVFDAGELGEIAEAIRAFAQPGLVVFLDEVYEELYFPDAGRDPNEPVPRLSSLPGMWERCLTFSSGGKTFSITGWKVGWAVGPPELVRPVQAAAQWTHFCAPSPSQRAMALVLDEAEESGYYARIRQFYRAKRDRLMDILRGIDGLRPVEPKGTFFVPVASATAAEHVGVRASENEALDFALARWMPANTGVAAIPASTFISTEENKRAFGTDWLRFCFCKHDDELDEAGRRLARAFNTR